MPNRFLDPGGLKRTARLELVARDAVEGFLAGRHRSPTRGASAAYLDHRAYTPGDDPRSIDWKMYARSDKYYVKMFEDETNLRAFILLDCSRSMSFAKDGPSKFEFGAYLAASLSYLLLRQNDAVGLATLDRDARELVAPLAKPTQFRRILDRLDAVAPNGETSVSESLHVIAERIGRRSLVILISDLLDDEDRFADALQHLRHQRHEVLVFHVLDDAELNFPYDRPAHFAELEGDGRITADPRALRKSYLTHLQTFLQRVQGECEARHVSYSLANTKDPYDLFLAAYLDKRQRL
ncbi:MAG TPA: DUF58 domain-containing protein [Pirellulales bacterium]